MTCVAQKRYCLNSLFTKRRQTLLGKPEARQIFTSLSKYFKTPCCDVTLLFRTFPKVEKLRTDQFHLQKNYGEGLKLVSKMALKKWNSNFRLEHSVQKNRRLFQCHSPRNSRNSAWDVKGTHVFPAFYWKTPGNKWDFEKVVLFSCWKLSGGNTFFIFEFSQRITSSRLFTATCVTILNFGDESVKELNLFSMEQVLHSMGPLHGSFSKFLVNGKHSGCYVARENFPLERPKKSCSNQIFRTLFVSKQPLLNTKSSIPHNYFSRVCRLLFRF